jgi:hypothetical protein
MTMCRPRLGPLAFALVLFALPVAANAPPQQYARYTKASAEIQDDQTKLAWERFNTRTKKQLAGARLQCNAFGSGARIPTVKELLTIVDEEPHTDYEFGALVQRTIDPSAFGSNTAIDAPYWTSTPTGNANANANASEFWGVSFADGTMKRLNANSDAAYVRCVR